MKEIYLPESACKMAKAILKRGEPAIIRQNIFLACDGNRMGVHKLMDSVEKPIYVTPDILDNKGTYIRIMDGYMLTYGDSKHKRISYDESCLYDATFCDLYMNNEFYVAPFIKSSLCWHDVNWKFVCDSYTETSGFTMEMPFGQVSDIITKMDAKNAIVNLRKDKHNRPCAVITVSENCIVFVMGYQY